MLGLAVGEQQRQLAARQPRPGAHRAGVDVHEGDARRRIIADAADLADGRRPAKLLQGNVGEGGVDRLSRHVLAFLRLAAARLAQHLVRRFRAVAADDVDRLLAAELGVHLPQQIDGLGIHLDRLVEAPVAHQPVDLLQGFAVVLPILLVGDGQRFLGVDVEERDRPRRAEGRDDVGRAGAHAQNDSGQAAEDSLFTQYQRATPCPDRSRLPCAKRLTGIPVCDRHSRSLRVNAQPLTVGNHG